ncbi:MAG: SDR family oxidoreductase [Acidobacteria bacterium]|nr:SDR family oxidoreductase [Acidobacteriota bacterium]
MMLTSRVVLLTGAKRIGAEIAAAVAARGADVAVVYRRSAAEARQVEERVQSLGRRALLIQADVADPAACRSAVAAVDLEFGRLDVLVNMASVYHQVAFDELDAAEWRRQLSVDLDGSFHCAMAAVPVMRRHGGGRIVNFADWVAASRRPRYPGFLAYYVAKAGVQALTEALALEVAADQILVNAIAPGPILAPPGTSETELEAVVAATPLGRWGGADEIVKAVLALIETDFITGETIRVDGGRHLR